MLQEFQAKLHSVSQYTAVIWGFGSFILAWFAKAVLDVVFKRRVEQGFQRISDAWAARSQRAALSRAKAIATDFARNRRVVSNVSHLMLDLEIERTKHILNVILAAGVSLLIVRAASIITGDTYSPVVMVALTVIVAIVNILRYVGYLAGRVRLASSPKGSLEYTHGRIEEMLRRAKVPETEIQEFVMQYFLILR